MIERIEINLLPAVYRVHKSTFRIQREVAYPLLIILVAGFMLLLWSLNLQNMIHQANNEITSLDQQIKQNLPIQNEINQLRKDNAFIQEKILALERINVNREKWVRLMEELSGRLPDYTWLVSVKEENSAPPVLHIEGRTYRFLRWQIICPISRERICDIVDLSNIEQIDPRKKLYRFIVSCSINPDVKLETGINPQYLANGEPGK